MEVSEKIITLRKTAGLSQEELAERLGVSRQAVSKWETGQSMPDLDNILAIADAFGVTTDALLRNTPSSPEEPRPEETTSEEVSRSVPQHSLPVISVSKQEAALFLQQAKKTAPGYALSVALFILSPIPLLLLAGLQACGNLALSEAAAAGLGVIGLLLLAALGVLLCLQDERRLERWKPLSRSIIELSSQAETYVRQTEADENAVNGRLLSAAIVLYVLCVIPIFVLLLIQGEDPDAFGGAAAVSGVLFLAAIGTFLILIQERRLYPVQVLLQKEDYSLEDKLHPERKKPYTAWWLVWTLIYLIWSFVSSDWERSWICWLAAGILYPVYVWIVRSLQTKKAF